MSAIFWYLTVLLTVVVCLSIALTVAVTGVPTLPSSSSEVDDVIALLKRAQLPEHAVIFDLGSGWGTLVVALAKAFPNASVHGVEISPFPYLISRLRTSGLANASVRWENFFRSDLKQADAITCYLMPGLMPSVCELLDKNLKPGTRVIANTFLFRGRTISTARQGALRGPVALYVWPARHWVAA